MKTILCLSLLYFWGLLAANSQTVQPREKYNFNAGWKMAIGDKPGNERIDADDHDWQKITLPHAFNENDAFKKSIEELSTGIAWYRKNFKLPEGSKGKKIFVEFEGIRLAGEFYLNGKWIGRSENGIMAFGFDITNVVKFDSVNVLAARIDNSWSYREQATQSPFQWNDRNFYANYGGINKNVFLHITNPVYQTLPLYSSLGTTGTYVYATDINVPDHSAVVNVESQVKNETNQPRTVSCEVEISDQEGKRVASFHGSEKSIPAGALATISARTNLKNIHFWSWGYGYLYQVNTMLKIDNKVVDVVKITTGFRKTEFGNGTIKLNDRTIQVKGYAQRTTNEWPAIGLSVPAWLSDYSNHLMVEGNANLVRWMHVTPWKQDIESCDRVGLMEAMPAGDSEGDPSGRRWEQRMEVMKDAIIYNRNNPSIVFYECGNKGISETHMQQMKQIRDEWDPFGGRAIGSREMMNSPTAEYGGEMLYINKSAGKPMWSMEYSRDEGMRKYWDEFSPPFHKDGEGPLYKGQPAPEYNHNQDSHAIEDVKRWFDYWNERPGTGKRVNSGGVNIIFSESNTHHRGEANYRVSGEVDAMRIPKDGFYANQIMWDGWVDNERTGIHILGHWNYAEGVVKNIYAVSSAEKVELFVNGRSTGFGERNSHFLFTFRDIAWKPGTIRAVGYDANGRQVCETTHETVGSPSAIKLSLILNPLGFRADGADLALVQVEVVDNKGNRCPTALNRIRFELEGAGEWRGGIAQGPDNFILSKDLPVEGGVNRVFVRSLPQAGKIVLKASSSGLKETSVTFSSTSVEVRDGLSVLLPGDGQTARLDRGPTPSSPSYAITRIPLKVINATAGSNGGKAALSYDDNETTDWFSEGPVSNAWIQYELEKESPVSEVTLKLNGFRTKSYPIRILVGDKQVWSGVTPHTLGYCTLTFPPQTGRTVKIQLTDGISTQENSSVEVNGKSLDDGVKRNDAGAKGRLSIIEAEIYSDLPPIDNQIVKKNSRGRLADKPLFRDPIFDGAADPTIIWNKKEKRWFMFYTNRRANAGDPGGVAWVHGTRIGIAESTDDGATWKYRDTANINYRPTSGYTHWAPEVIEHKGLYHMYLTYVPGVFTDWNHPRDILHLTSSDLLNWKYESTLKLASDRVIDACVIQLPNGHWRMWYNNEKDKKSIYYADSPDLYTWQDKGKAVGDRSGEGPNVFRWKNKYWMLVDNWAGMGLYHSDDLLIWTKQPERILEKPGTGPEDGTMGGHADVIVSGDRAFVIYFLHPGRTKTKPASADPVETRRSLIQIAELEYADGNITCNRDNPVYLKLKH